MTNEKQLYKEIVTQRVGNKVVASTIREATEREVRFALDYFKETGDCDCSIVYDEDCWPYWSRICFVCKKSLGII